MMRGIFRAFRDGWDSYPWEVDRGYRVDLAEVYGWGRWWRRWWWTWAGFTFCAVAALVSLVVLAFLIFD